MLKKRLSGMMILIVGIMLIFGFTACGDGSSSSGGKIPYALVGKWYSKANPDMLMFEITSAGKITLNSASNDTFDLTVSGNAGELLSNGTSISTFNYAISGGELTISNATFVMMPFMSFSPMIKKSGSNSGGGGLSALVGDWQSNGTTVFQVTAAGKFIMNDTTYDISVSGNTATLKFGGTQVGTFDYAINNGQMVIFNGTMIGMTIALFSPVGKSGGENPSGPDVGIVILTGITAEYTGTDPIYSDTPLDDLKAYLTVIATYNNGNMRTVSDNQYTLEGYLAVGTVDITVRYQDKEATFMVTVMDVAVEIEHYNLGDIGPGGGIIFYYSAEGFYMTDTYQLCHYLEAAPDDMPYTYSLNVGDYVGVYGTEIGAGRENTATLLNTGTSNQSAAAKVCSEYSNGGETDWFLPSKDELNELYINRAYVGNMSETSYWSSSKTGTNSGGWLQRFHRDGEQEDYTFIHASCSVRAVRAF
jgi:hypothetical protein